MDTFLGSSEEENNIRYVAYTRAKNELYLVSDPKRKKKAKIEEPKTKDSEMCNDDCDEDYFDLTLETDA